MQCRRRKESRTGKRKYILEEKAQADLITDLKKAFVREAYENCRK